MPRSLPVAYTDGCSGLWLSFEAGVGGLTVQRDTRSTQVADRTTPMGGSGSVFFPGSGSGSGSYKSWWNLNCMSLQSVPNRPIVVKTPQALLWPHLLQEKVDFCLLPVLWNHRATASAPRSRHAATQSSSRWLVRGGCETKEPSFFYRSESSGVEAKAAAVAWLR